MTLLVREATDGEKDPFGASATLADAVEATGCLFAPGAPQGISGDRPNGAHVIATAHFPRGWASRLRGAKVSADGGKTWLDVIGEPVEFPEGSLPASWRFACQVELGRYDG